MMHVAMRVDKDRGLPHELHADAIDRGRMVERVSEHGDLLLRRRPIRLRV